MATRLIIVEEAYRGRGRGIMLEPKFLADGPSPPFTVQLKLPDGTERETRAELETSHMRIVGGSVFALIRLTELAPEDVPPDTEVWRVGARSEPSGSTE